MTGDPAFDPASLVVLRTPLLPFDEVEAWSAELLAPRCEGDEAELREALAHDRVLLRRRLQALLEQPEIREAVFLASPDLSQSLAQWRREPQGKKGQRTEHGLVRYFLRMASRPTPFGLFAGCTAGTAGERTRLDLAARRSYRRHSRLDMDYLFALCEHLAKSSEARAELRFRPNSSLYAAAGRLRYAEARLAERLRTYHLVAVDTFEVLASTLERAAHGARLGDLAAALVAEDPEQEITVEDAAAFVHDLVDNQLLVPDLALQVTGEESGPVLVDELAGLGSVADVCERLGQAQRQLAGIDSQGLGASPDHYRAIADHLEPLGVSVELSRLFQVDLTKPSDEVVLGPDVLAEIERGVELLHRLAPVRDEGPLAGFCTAFKDRYGEGRELPLLLVLDEESGIGFERSVQAAAEASPLLAGLAFHSRRERWTVAWSGREAVLLRLLGEALRKGRPEVALTEEDLARLTSAERPPLPDSFHVMLSLAARSPAALEEGDFRLLLAHAGGPSGANLLGRFCHADAAICAGVEAHLAAEEALTPDALFAEVVHLPAGRIGNILARPVLRRYEVPFLGRSGAPEAAQIPAGDLLVTVFGDRIRLRSQRLGREVIPRLTTAHNAARESLGIYRFLAALQGQGRAAGLRWSWGPLETAPYLPRVTSGRLVLSRARWCFGQAEIKPLASAVGTARYRLARRWREELAMPRFVVLADGDNELLLDFDNVLSLDAVIELVKNRHEVVLTEIYPGPDELCASGPEGRFIHELIVPFVRRSSERSRALARAQTRAVALAPSTDASTVPARQPVRTFPPGSEWLYAKVYTGTGTADQVLRDEIGPLAREALASGAARSWFFVRYGDPDWHLRVRFQGEPETLRSQVLPRLEGVFNRLLAAGSAWKIQLDTYEREVERYGGSEGIALAEELFFHDSEAVLGMLESLRSDAGADLRWRLMLVGIDRLLDDLDLDLESKLHLAERARAGLAGRYRHETLREPMAGRLRRERADLVSLLAAPETAREELRPGLAALARRSQDLAPVTAELRERERRGLLRTPLSDIRSSFVHMFVNRASRSAGPEHELVLYDFLVQLYRSQQARARTGHDARASSAASALVAKGPK